MKLLSKFLRFPFVVDGKLVIGVINENQYVIHKFMNDKR